MRVSGVRLLKNHFPSSSHSFNLALPEWQFEIKKQSVASASTETTS